MKIDESVVICEDYHDEQILQESWTFVDHRVYFLQLPKSQWKI